MVQRCKVTGRITNFVISAKNDTRMEQYTAVNFTMRRGTVMARCNLVMAHFIGANGSEAIVKEMDKKNIQTEVSTRVNFSMMKGKASVR